MSRLSRFQSELDRLFDEAMRLAARERRAGEHEPPIDVLETESEVVVLIEVPGISREHLALWVEGGSVVLAGTKRLRPPTGARRFHGVEREQGRFERRIDLLQAVDTRRASARLAGGLLTLSFPRIEEKRSRRRRLEIEEVSDPSSAAPSRAAGEEAR